MRDDETMEADLASREELPPAVEADHAPPSGAAPPPAAPVPRRPRGKVLAGLSYLLSATVVVAAFCFVLAVGLRGHFESEAQVGSPAAAGGKPGTKLASNEPPAAAPPAARGVPVLVARSEKRAAPITADAVGKAESVAAITVRTRVDGQIAKVLFKDGQAVKEGDVLYELDARQIDAQIRQAEAVVAKDRAQIEQTQRDLARNEQLVRTNVGSVVNLQNAQTADALARAALAADQAALDNLRVQRSYYTIVSPVTGRVGIGIQREGSAIRAGDASGTLVTVNQITPIYVNFALPQKLFPALQSASGRGGAPVTATIQGSAAILEGKVVAIDNTADATSGNIGVRASFQNDNEILWPGLLCNITVTLGHDDAAVVIPRDAVQSSQDGTIVFVVEKGVARIRKVVVDRFEGATAIIGSGLKGGETVVTDGQLRLVDGTPVSPQPDKRRRGDRA
jgi:multidrug efflux system membrane fusion protein